MIEIPESFSRAKELKTEIIGKQVINVIANSSPHKFAFFYKDNPSIYSQLITNKKVTEVTSHGGQIDIVLEDVKVVLGDGVNISYLNPDQIVPLKHQLLLEFSDHSKVVCTIQMYGFLLAFEESKADYYYYLVSVKKPSVFSDQFNYEYFISLINPFKDKTMSVKAFLATEQRIPGLGNGVLQDILFNAKIHPKRKLNTLNDDNIKDLFQSIKSTLCDMAEKGGRDTENNIYGKPGAYQTILSSKTNNTPCKICNTLIKKEAYMGGSIYYCDNCQK